MLVVVCNILAEKKPLIQPELFDLFLNFCQGECSRQRKRDNRVRQTLIKNRNTNGHLRRPINVVNATKHDSAYINLTIVQYYN